MNQTDQRDLLKLLRLIMSSKSKEEQQKEALRCLQSNPDVLLSLLKLTLGSESADIQTNIFGNHGMKNIGENSLLCNDGKCQQRYSDAKLYHSNDINSSNVIQSCFPVAAIENKFVEEIKNNDGNHINKPLEIHRCQDGANNNVDDHNRMNLDSEDGVFDRDIDMSNDIKPTKKRKSKYDYIQGDLSHIRREPKCTKADKHARKKRTCKTKRSREHSGSWAAHEQQKQMDVDNDVALAQRLLDILLHPKSRQHQECVIALLRSDSHLRRLFIAEKAKLGKQRIPVYRKIDVTNHSNQPEQTKAFQRHNEVQRSSNFEPIDQSADAFINFLSTILNSSNPPENQDEGTNGSSCIDERLRDIPIGSLISESGGHINIPSDFNDTILPSATGNGNRFNVRFEDANDVDVSISPQSGLELGLNIMHPVAHDAGFDAALHEHFQHLSHELYTVNNVEPTCLLDMKCTTATD